MAAGERPKAAQASPLGVGGRGGRRGPEASAGKGCGVWSRGAESDWGLLSLLWMEILS